MSKPTPVGRYIDLYRELCGATPTLNNQECEVITRLVAEAHSREGVTIDLTQAELEHLLVMVNFALSNAGGPTSEEEARILEKLRNALPTPQEQKS